LASNHNSRICHFTSPSLLFLTDKHNHDHHNNCIENSLLARETRPTVRPTMRGTFVDD
jgi:hypothetical protein